MLTSHQNLHLTRHILHLMSAHHTYMHLERKSQLHWDTNKVSRIGLRLQRQGVCLILRSRRHAIDGASVVEAASELLHNRIRVTSIEDLAKPIDAMLNLLCVGLALRELEVAHAG